MEEKEKEQIRKDIRDFLELLNDENVKDSIEKIVRWEKEKAEELKGEHGKGEE